MISMFDFLANSVDGLIILAYIIALVVFFLYGPHKVYEAFFGALLGLGCYLFLYKLTFISPEFTRTLLFWNWLFDQRYFLLWWSHFLMIFLFFFAPISLGIHAGVMVRGSLWFLLKIVILSAFFVVFWVVILVLASGISPLMIEAPLYSKTFLQTPFFTNARLYLWIMERAHLIILGGVLLSLYKILLSHWMTKLTFFLGALYVKWDEIFGKKTFEQWAIPSAGDDVWWHDDHGGGDAHSWH